MDPKKNNSFRFNHIFDIIPEFINNKLTRINYSEGNKKLAKSINNEMVVISLLYALYCYYFFHGIWYLNLLIVVSTIIFGYNYMDVRIELVNNKINSSVPKTLNKLRYYLKHTGNIETTLDMTIRRSSESTKGFLDKLNEALKSENYRENIEEIKRDSKFEWAKIVCTLVLSCRMNGNKDGVVSDNFKKVTKTINFINRNRGMDNTAILGIQLFVFFLPLLAIPGITIFNSHLMEAFQTVKQSGGLEGQIQISRILLESNIYTIVLSWLRKNN